jgi:hypothetical protein
MTYDATYSQEPNYNHHHLAKLLSIFALNPIYSNSFEKLETYIQVEDSGYPNGTEETNENCLSCIFDLVYQLMESKNYR